MGEGGGEFVQPTLITRWSVQLVRHFDLLAHIFNCCLRSEY